MSKINESLKMYNISDTSLTFARLRQSRLRAVITSGFHYILTQMFLPAAYGTKSESWKHSF